MERLSRLQIHISKNGYFLVIHIKVNEEMVKVYIKNCEAYVFIAFLVGSI